MKRTTTGIEWTSRKAGALSELLTYEQTAELMNMSVRHVRRLVEERRIAFHRLGRSVRIAAEDVAEYIRDARIEPIDEATVWNDLKGAA